MEPSVPPSATVGSHVENDRRAAWILFALVALVWLPALHRFSFEWSFNPQYYYGWAVPLLAAYLIYEQWLGRPPMEPPRRRGAILILIGLLASAQLPLRLLSEANSSARLISLAMGIVAFGVSMGALYLVGGRKWLLHFAAPVAFLLVSMPWPKEVEKPLVQGLMRVNAEMAASAVFFMGIPAEARGNVIEVPTGVLGVNEACSGIRSLQSTLMAAVFLGLLYRRSALGVLGLVLAGAFIAFLSNVVRTTFLTYEGAVNGIEAVDKWHDSAGFAILGVVLVCLWLMSQWLEKRSLPTAKKSSAATAG